MKTTVRPDFHTYFMAIADAVRARSNCLGRNVGAILVKNERIISTGYNGTPAGMKNCTDGGCFRCANRAKTYPSGVGYDVCICVHAEQNALLSAARFGIPVEGATLYSTHQPCFNCAKEMLQAKVRAVYYVERWTPQDAVRKQYDIILKEFPGGIHAMSPALGKGRARS